MCQYFKCVAKIRLHYLQEILVYQIHILMGKMVGPRVEEFYYIKQCECTWGINDAKH